MVTHIPASPTHSTTSLNYLHTNPVHPSNPSAYLYSSDASSTRAGSSSSSRRRPSDTQSVRSSTSSRTATTSNPPSSYKHGSSTKRSSSRSSTRSSSSTLRPSETRSTTRSVAPSQAESTSRRSSQQRHHSTAQSDAGRGHISDSRHSYTRSNNVRSSATTNYDQSTREQFRQQQNSFPYFSQTGDVEIIIADPRKREVHMYLLHSMFLAQNSRWWAEQLNNTQHRRDEGYGSTSDIPGGMTSSRGARRDTNGNHKRYELYWGDDHEESSMSTMPILVRSRDDQSYTSSGNANTSSRPPPTRNKPAASSSSFHRSLSSASHTGQQYNSDISTYESDILTAYDNLLRIIYNHAPTLDSTNPATAYVECKHLLALASMYDCLSITGPRVEHHLLHFRSLLPQQIAKYPPSYLKLAYKARSRTLFNDALVHVVGSWPLHASQLARGDIPSRLRDLVDDKVDELDEARAKAEAKLFRLTLTTNRGERVNPSNSWLDWLAVSLFRQWVAENTTPVPAGILKPSNGEARSSGGRSSSVRASNQQSQNRSQLGTDRVYRLLASSSSSAYLDHDELKRFLKMSQPASLYTRDTLKRFERRMDELKNLAREAVMPLTRNFLELVAGREKQVPPYLTCTRMGEGDWEFLWGAS